MSDDEAKTELEKIHAELRKLSQALDALKFPTSLIDRVLTLSGVLQKSILRVEVTEDSLSRLVTDVQHDLNWLRKHVAELNRLLSGVLAPDEPKKNGG